MTDKPLNGMPAILPAEALGHFLISNTSLTPPFVFNSTPASLIPAEDSMRMMEALVLSTCKLVAGILVPMPTFCAGSMV